MLKYNQIPGIFKLEGSRLGRPYHRLPHLFTNRFDVIESRLSVYFIKKHRTNITLKKISCEMDVTNKTAELLISSIGHLAFDIDRPLLMTLLNNFYGLEETKDDDVDKHPTKTEIRLKNRLAIDLCNLIFSQDTTGLTLKFKTDNSTVLTQWAYQITFYVGENEQNCFHILLDDTHTDYILNNLRHNEYNHQGEKNETSATEKSLLVKHIINTLPMTLTAKVAEIPLNVADLTMIKAGDILPISLPKDIPIYIGKSELFNALIVEDKEKLYLSEMTSTTSENTYD